jgi:putative tryptophan/tyrosine transport system substrate-binding protein
MRRREFITLIGGAAAWPVAARAQRMWRIGILGWASVPLPYKESFQEGMRDLGYIERENLIIEGREGSSASEAADLVKLRVDVIFAAGGSEATRAARQETTNIPIVTISSNPVGLGLIASLAQPGGNITGLSLQSPEASGKRLELLKQMVPRLARISLLSNPHDPGTAFQLQETQAAAATLGLNVQVLEMRDGNAFEDAFEAAGKGNAEAVVPLPAPLMDAGAGRIAELALKHRLPTMYHTDILPRAGGLMSYGVSLASVYKRAAYYVDRILKGTRPADLPVEQPTKFDLTINLKTATALGIEVPPTLLGRADEVIE